MGDPASRWQHPRGSQDSRIQLILGHGLQQLGRIELRAHQLRDGDTLARIGGDEFIILLPDVDTEENVMKVAEKIRAALILPIDIEGFSLITSASIGVAIFPYHGLNASDLMNNADVAMYSAKSKGRNTIVMYGDHIAKTTIKDLL